MKTFTPGLYAAILITVAALSASAGITKIAKRATAPDKPATAPDKPAVVQKDVPAENFLVNDVSETPPVQRAPWFTPGMWSVIRTGQSTIICLYSDERIAVNVKSNSANDGSTDGMLCIAKRPNDWQDMVDLPSRAKYEWDVRGLIDAEFTMKDGSKYFAHYFVKPMRKGETMVKVETMAEFKDFGRLVTAARTIRISTRTVDGIVTQNFQNKMDQ
jgi:hypothetical protein